MSTVRVSDRSDEGSRNDPHKQIVALDAEPRRRAPPGRSIQTCDNCGAMSLWGIETAEQCREHLDRIIVRCHEAQTVPTPDSISTLRETLQEIVIRYSPKTYKQMSTIEAAWFWPAVCQAHGHRPSLHERHRWQERIFKVLADLKSGLPDSGRASFRE